MISRLAFYKELVHPAYFDQAKPPLEGISAETMQARRRTLEKFKPVPIHSKPMTEVSPSQGGVFVTQQG